VAQKRRDLRERLGGGLVLPPEKCGLQSRLWQDVSCAVAFAIVVLTQRLELRLPVERDRERFVRLFSDREFMVFSTGVLDREAANRRFDQMLILAEEFPFAKQPVIDRSTGQILGYSGVDRFEFEGRSRLEYGYRLAPEARGRGYATEAGRAMLAEASKTYRGELLAMIDPTNHASQSVAHKLGFSFWKQALVDGYLDNLYRLQLGGSH
jgi:RimJ/RimL family protein N-acetyltransferase